MTATPSALALGTVIASQFRIERMLGQGGMGSVFLADQLDMGRSVVIKVLNPELTAGNNVAVERFRREAQAVARLNHPNIVQIFVFGHTEEQQLYIAMEYVEGHDLGVDIEAGAMAQQRALRILDQVCAALIEAHSAGIVHRDLKPENIMITNRHGNPDYVKVLDFGIAKLHDQGDQPSLTQAGTVFGTPRYMAPEQARGQNADARADIYALGVIFHEMLTGHHPFQATTALDYLLHHVNEPVPPIHESHPGLNLTPRVEAIIYRCLEKSPDDRYQSVAELQREARLALRDFSEASRGYPSSPSSAVGGPARPQAARQVSATSTAPGRDGQQPARKGMPVWGWVAIGLGLSAGLVAAVIAGSSGKGGPETSSPLAILTGTPKEGEGLPGADPTTHEDPPTDPNTVVAGTDDDDDDDGGNEIVEVVESPEKPSTDPKTPIHVAIPGKKKVDINAVAKRLATMTDDDTPADELIARLSEDELWAINKFVEGGGDLEALVAKYAKPTQVAVAVEEDDTHASGLQAGKSIDGFPVPAGARSTFSTSQAELFEISAPAHEIIAFYKNKLRGRYAFEDIPNGISIKDPTSPFTFVVLTPNGDTLMLSLSRNVLAESTVKANTHNPSNAIFGVIVPGKTSIIVKSETAVVLRSRMSMTDLCDYFRNKYGNLPKVVSVGDPEGATPSCVIANSGGDYAWQAITAVNDPQSAGALMVSISKAQ